MRIIVLTDLDETLFSTRVPICAGAGGPRELCTHPDADIKPAFWTEKQAALWKVLVQKADIRIPVTARSEKAFNGVALEFPHGHVLNFGASVYGPGGELDQVWHQKMHAASLQMQQHKVFTALHPILSDLADAVTIRDAGGFSCFLHVRATVSTIFEVKTRIWDYLQKTKQTHNYYIHVSNSILFLLPNFVRKDLAVQHLFATQGYDNDLVFGMGDSLSDVGFMGLCDFLVLPRDADATQQLFDAAMRAEVLS